MIAEILITKSIVTGTTRVVVYPRVGALNPRVHLDPSEASCERLERMMRKHTVRPYFRKRGISVWISR